MIINPELATAREISRLLRFPAAIKIDPFSRGRVELLKFKVLPEFGLDGMSISQITDKYRCDILFCAIESKTTLSIPGGDHLVIMVILFLSSQLRKTLPSFSKKSA